MVYKSEVISANLGQANYIVENNLRLMMEMSNFLAYSGENHSSRNDFCPSTPFITDVLARAARVKRALSSTAISLAFHFLYIFLRFSPLIFCPRPNISSSQFFCFNYSLSSRSRICHPPPLQLLSLSLFL